MLLDEPARAPAVVERLKRLDVGFARLMPDRVDRPDRSPDAAAQITPAVADPKLSDSWGAADTSRSSADRRPDDGSAGVLVARATITSPPRPSVSALHAAGRNGPRLAAEAAAGKLGRIERVALPPAAANRSETRESTCARRPRTARCAAADPARSRGPRAQRSAKTKMRQTPHVRLQLYCFMLTKTAAFR